MNKQNYNFIDLGLPSGTLWCDRNVGAETPEDAGLYFAWGETQGYTAEDVANGAKAFSWDDYKFGKDYNKKTVLDPEDDAATVNLGDDAKMPTQKQCQELFNNTDKVLMLTDGSEVEHKCKFNDYQFFGWPSNNYNGVDIKFKGVKFINRQDPSKFIFVPAAGIAYENEICSIGDEGYFWSSSLYDGNTDSAWECLFHCFGALMHKCPYCYGHSVRAIKNK